MGALRLRFLDDSEEDPVHAESLRCLREVGVMVRSPAVLDILEKAGAIVDRKAGVAKLPESLVTEALKKAPKSIRLHARDPRHDLQLPVEKTPYVATNGLAVYTLDLETGEKRASTRKDIAAFGKLADGLSGVDYFWTTMTATEVPQGAHSLHELWTALQGCTKHVQGVSIINAADGKAQVELGAIIAGGRDELRKKPVFSVICCTVAPLSFERGAIEGQVELARAGIPVVSMSMSLSGLTSPVTVAGTIVNANAENLASLVITQCACPGSPHIYSSESAPIDMATGNINYYAPEYPFIASALGQMAHRYRLPSLVGSWGSGGERPGIPESLSEIYGMTITMFSGTDLASGIGSIDVAKGVAMEQAVLDSWLWEDVKVFLRKYNVDKEATAFDIIKDVGHTGSFLTHPHTQRNFRKELFIRDKGCKPWQKYPIDRMVSDAREHAKKILREHDVPGLDPDLIAQGDRVISEFERTVAH